MKTRLNLIGLIILILIGCEIGKNPTDSKPKIFGIIMGDGKVLPRKPVAEARIYIYDQDSLIAESVSNASGLFYLNNLQAGTYRLEIKKYFEFENFAHTSVTIEYKGEQDLGTIFLSNVHDDYFPLKIGCRWLYDCSSYSKYDLGGNWTDYKLSITIQDTCSSKDTTYYNIQCKKETYFRSWRSSSHESTNTDIIIEQWQDQFKEFDGYIKSDILVGFHILSDLREFLETTGFADELFLGNNVPQIEQKDFESIGGKIYRSLVIKALYRYLDWEKQIVLSPNFGVIEMQSVRYSAHSGGGLYSYLEEYTP
jgi:hypothetical protein